MISLLTIFSVLSLIYISVNTLKNMFWATHGCVHSNLCQVISKFFKFSKKEALISHRTSS